MKAFHPHLYAITSPGLEPICAAELRALGAGDVSEMAGGVQFSGGAELLMRSNLWLRSASRVLWVVAGGRATTWPGLEKLVRRFDWDAVLHRRTPIRLKVACSASRLYHEGAVKERLQGMISRSPGSVEDPETVEIWVRIHRDTVTISLDSSGELLHRRGYRTHVGRAPVRESLAAGVLLASGWDPTTPLLDPMCGSGTFPIEASWLAQRRAPGLLRAFAFQRWLGYRADAWKQQVREARAQQLPAEGLPEIVGVDIDVRVLDAARHNAVQAQSSASFEHADIRHVGADGPPGLVVVNPPYGKRIGSARTAFALVQQLMDRMPDWNALVMYAL
ncbi:MAG: putative N6-adenine-specific DNA methylase, partial [Myxococcota bacterium]